MSDWSWKVDDPASNRGLNLRYEPGNWGDVLKGLWAVCVAEHLGRERAPGEVLVLDPFAGAPAYPLLPGVAARLATAPVPRLRAALTAWIARGELPSTASLVLEALRRSGARPRAAVFDVDAERAAAWSRVAGAERLDVADGGQALLDHPAADLVLVDPYDLFERFEALVPPTLRRHQGVVLLYLFNKAPRGAAIHRRYADLRERLDRALDEEQGARRLLVGRLASDAVLPRAYHEILLVAPTAFADAVAAELGEGTRALARYLAEAGAFE